jgi:hypothetical protein
MIMKGEPEYEENDSSRLKVVSSTGDETKWFWGGRVEINQIKWTNK